jgi:pimeloyl-ACP methyl ester carboxylesterase
VPDSEQEQQDIFLKGSSQQTVFLFLSGLGSGSADLLPLATAIRQEGYSCELLSLPINITDDRAWSGIDAAAVTEQIHAVVSRHAALGRAVYLVGFSLGASFALTYAAAHACQGVVAISTFLRPSRPGLARLFFRWRRLTGRYDLNRTPQVSAPATMAHLRLRRSLPIGVVEAAIGIGAATFARLPQIACPVLFLHSFDDRVADYAAVAEAVMLCGSPRRRLVSFNHLNHYIQFDVRPADVSAFVLHYLGLPRATESLASPPAEPAKSAADLLKLYTEERRHWSLVLFQTIAGFFTFFSLLLYNSLSDVVTETAKAPYFLLSYSLASSIYLTLSILYFFYTNRVDVYVKFHVEPLLQGVSWAAFRTSRWMAGGESYRFTRLATIPLMVTPSCLSVLSLLACVLQYHAKLLDFGLQYIVLKVLFLLACFLCLYTVYAIGAFNRFTRRWLYLARPAERSDFPTEALLMTLYQSVRPGCVRPPARPDDI